ncbi:hypothetical protein FGIG_01675 [Fasciola gigantica]|uniref:Zinc metalloproteinase n=1 Tax=Fasciola gigantica TaxID=46835 RepID=A0A504YNS6_FASGI|nr:hypothetical protein FGIG_01675 [Fasciola gigantica]
MIKLINAHDMMIVNYALLQLKGFMDPFCGCDQLVVCCLSTEFHELKWAMCYGKFKVFVPLCPGENQIILKCAHFEVEFHVVYKVLKLNNQYDVIPVYVICADGPEHFQAPAELRDSSKYGATKRILFGMQLLQSLTAESLLAELGKRCTFLLHRDTDQLTNKCLIHRSKMSLAEVYEANSKQVWNKLAHELYATYPSGFDRKKWIAFMACTRHSIPESVASNGILPYEEILRTTRGYFALGSGGLALLGTGTLHAWPEGLADLQGALLDTRKLEPFGMMNDTAYRHTFWAAFATGLGSVWHEMGHCFGLDHSLDGIMNRGGDDINLCISFPPRGSNCLDGCMWIGRNGPPCPSCRLSEHIPPQFRPSPAIEVGVQFRRYTCLAQINPRHNSNYSPYRTSSCFSFCNSLWHQGSAYWGFDQAVKLTRNPWIVRCP